MVNESMIKLALTITTKSNFFRKLHGRLKNAIKEQSNKPDGILTTFKVTDFVPFLITSSSLKLYASELLPADIKLCIEFNNFSANIYQF